MVFHFRERLRRLRRRLSRDPEPPIAQPQIQRNPRGPAIVIPFQPGFEGHTPLSRSRASLPSRLQHNLACFPAHHHSGTNPRHSAPPRILAATNVGPGETVSRLALPPSGVADRHVPSHVNAARTGVQFWAPVRPRSSHVPVILPIGPPPSSVSESGRSTPRAGRRPMATLVASGPAAPPTRSVASLGAGAPAHLRVPSRQ